MSVGRKRCFVIMPFSQTSDKHTEEYWTKHFELFLKPTIEECPELEAYRSEPLRGDIIRQIITDLVVSPVVVADLTDLNPNVFWELGIRQSFKHGTVTIAQEGTQLPFDLGVKGTLFYCPDNHIENAKFCLQFKKSLTDCLSHPDAPDSSVLETLSGRGSLFEIISRDEVRRRVEALVSECRSNVRILERIYARIEKNIKESDNPETVAERLRPSAMELLVVNRYLDEDSSFYSSLDQCYETVNVINDQLVLWRTFLEPTQKWFIDNKEMFLKRFKDYEIMLTSVQEKLMRSIIW